MADMVKRNNIFLIPFTKLKILDNFNDRQDYGTTEEMNELTESIYNNGCRVPLMGYKDGEKYVVMQGHRRFRAGEKIKEKYKKTIIYKMIVYPPGTTDKEMLLDTLLTNSGKDLTPLEKASVVTKLIAEKATTKEIAAALGGVSEVYVKNLDRLSSAPEEAKKLIRDGVVSATLVIGYLKNKNANMEEFIQEVKKQAELEGSGTGKGKGNKKKQAKVTAKKVTKKDGAKGSSLAEFKRFMKQNPDTFESKDKQAAYEFFTQVINNKVSYLEILSWFTGK